MIYQILQRLQRAKVLPLLTLGALLALLLTAGNAGASPPFSRLFAGPPPPLINYQGVVAVNGRPYNGPGYFKFAVVNSPTGNGSINY
jgi:hypothetical protein